MSTDSDYTAAVATLRGVLASIPADSQVAEIISARDEVLARYQPVFTAEGIQGLTAERFLEFLRFRNNRHWTGLQRLGPRITDDMDALRAALAELIDEAVPVSVRLDKLLPGGIARVPGLGKAVLTAILFITRPDDYGVWNGTSEGGLKAVGLWPEFAWGTTYGRRYEELAALLRSLADDLETDLWTLDALWWQIVKEVPEEAEQTDRGDELEGDSPEARFSLERHVQDFLLENWESTALGRDWALAEEGGDIKGYGYERPTPIGRIDLLARHRTEPRWLVIELKRGQTSDSTLGQVLRYMGWVMEELAGDEEAVEGAIISHEGSDRLRYALRTTPNVRFMRYAVKFELSEE